MAVGIGRTKNLFISFTTHENVVVNYSMKESIVFPFIPWHYYTFREILVRVYHKFNVVWLLHFMGGKQFQFIKQLYRKCQWYSLPYMSSSVENNNHVIIILGNNFLVLIYLFIFLVSTVYWSSRVIIPSLCFICQYM